MQSYSTFTGPFGSGHFCSIEPTRNHNFTALNIHAIHLVCAGTNGQETEEDFLGAGSIVHAGVTESSRNHVLDSVSEKASAKFLRVVNDSSESQSQLVESFRQSQGGKNLISLGMESDLVLAAAMDRCSLVPRLCPESGQLMSSNAV